MLAKSGAAQSNTEQLTLVTRLLLLHHLKILLHVELLLRERRSGPLLDRLLCLLHLLHLLSWLTRSKEIIVKKRRKATKNGLI